MRVPNVFQVLVGHNRESLVISLRRDEMYAKGCECPPIKSEKGKAGTFSQ